MTRHDMARHYHTLHCNTIATNTACIMYMSTCVPTCLSTQLRMLHASVPTLIHCKQYITRPYTKESRRNLPNYVALHCITPRNSAYIFTFHTLQCIHYKHYIHVMHATTACKQPTYQTKPYHYTRYKHYKHFKRYIYYTHFRPCIHVTCVPCSALHAVHPSYSLHALRTPDTLKNIAFQYQKKAKMQSLHDTT